MKIQVTQEDIDKGRNRPEDALRCFSCPVFHALERQVKHPEIHKFRVELMDVTLYDSTQLIAVVQLPYEVRRFIWLFDTLHEVEPFEFEFELPSNLKQL